MKTILIMLTILLMASIVFAYSTYIVEVSYNDELFIINGEKFEAKTYCFNVNEGDKVIFLEGSPNGVCTSAVFKDLNTGTVCRCWCE